MRNAFLKSTWVRTATCRTFVAQQSAATLLAHHVDVGLKLVGGCVGGCVVVCKRVLLSVYVRRVCKQLALRCSSIGNGIIIQG